KADSKGCHCGSFDTKMGVSQVSEFLRIKPEIISSNIKSPYKSDSAVNDRNLSVVPVIDAQLQLTQKCREKLCHLDAGLFETSPGTFPHFPAAHTVKKHPDFNTFLYFSCQYFFNFLP